MLENVLQQRLGISPRATPLEGTFAARKQAWPNILVASVQVSLHERLLERWVLGSPLAIPASGTHIQQFVPHLEGPGRNAHSSHTPGRNPVCHGRPSARTTPE